jgi:hypothetical protein
VIYTIHADKRMQQRSVPELAIELLARYGRAEYSPGGANIYYFDTKGWSKAERAIHELAANIDRIRDMYFVEGNDEVVITTGHRTNRVKRDYKFHRKAKRR